MNREMLMMLYNMWIAASPFIVMGLIIALIVVCIRKRGGDEGLSQGFTRKDFRYICIIFFIVIVFLFVIVLTGDESAFQYFSFASTITSIILSVIAIIMTILSDQKSESTKRSIEESVKIIRKVNKQIGAHAKQMEEYGKQIEQQIVLINCISDKLDEMKSKMVTTQDMEKLFHDKKIDEWESLEDLEVLEFLPDLEDLEVPEELNTLKPLGNDGDSEDD